MLLRKTNFPLKNCLRCGQEFVPKQWNQLYCGSKTEKMGCSGEREKERVKKRAKTQKFKDYQSSYGKEWKRNQRITNSEYAQRQKESKKRYAKTEQGKLTAKRWRNEHREAIRAANRRRKYYKMSVFGFHTQEEWESLKKKFDYRCADCGVREEELLVRYPGTQFGQLTRDHIIPTSKGGTDLILNIQPLCIGCNAKKQDRLGLVWGVPGLAPIIGLKGFPYLRESLGKVVCTSLPADPIHPGHLSCLQESAEYGDSLVVIVNGDWFLRNKKGRPLMPLEMRSQIVAGFRWVDAVVPFEIEEDTTVCEALKIIQPHVFTKGGDRCDPNTIPEWGICEEYGIRIVTGVGDSKIHSSSNILEDWYEHRLRLFMDT